MSRVHFENVHKYRLSNGLTVILEASHASPVVSINVGVRVGSAWESGNEAGLSHLLEHMVFKGTISTQPGEIATIVEASGGELNAFTSFDQTVYYINLSSRFLKKGLHLIKEMVFDATIDPVELAREKEVVIEELRRGKDNPQNQVSELLFKTAFTTHTYGRPIIGFEKTVREVPRDEVYGYYKRWYTPENMILALCGDFDLESVKLLIEEMFGKEPPAKITRPDLPLEPIPTKEKRACFPMNIEGMYLNIGFPIPSFSHPDIPAIDLAAHLLGDGETSLFVQNLKEKRGLVNSIHAGAYTPLFPGLFIIGANIPVQNDKIILEAIAEQIEHAKLRPFPEIQLERAKELVFSSVFYERETCEGTARKWMSFETTAGDFRFEEKYFEALEKVTVADIERVLRTYLDLNRATISFVHPQKIKPRLGAFKPTQAKKSARKVERIGEFKDTVLYRFANGIRFAARENHRVPLISLKYSALGGLRWENKRNNGLTHLTTSMLEKGTTSKSALQIAEISEKIAGSVDANTGRNSWGLHANFLSSKKNEGLDLFCDVLLNPAFDAKEFAKEKRLVLEAIKNQEDSSSHIAFRKFQATLYKTHPYGLPLLGSIETVRKATIEQARSLYPKILNPKNSVLSAVGDFNADQLAVELEDYLSALAPRPLSIPKIKPEKAPTSRREVITHKKKEQAHVVLGFLGTRIGTADHYTFEVLNNLLSGQGGRLFLELRDKMSLAYTVSSVMVEGIDPGYFATYIGTDPAKCDIALQEMLKQLERVTKEKVSEEELSRAKNYIIGNYEIDLQRNSAVASVLLYNELYHMGLEEFENYPAHIMKVTADDLLKLARKYLKLNATTLSMVRP